MKTAKEIAALMPRKSDDEILADMIKSFEKDAKEGNVMRTIWESNWHWNNTSFIVSRLNQLGFNVSSVTTESDIKLTVNWKQN